MKKTLISVSIITLILTGCSTTQNSNDNFSINENNVTINSEALTFTFPNDFEVKESKILFGPETFIPESPTDKEYTRKALYLSVEEQRNTETLKTEEQALHETPINFKTQKLNSENTYVTWTIPGLCDYTYNEIIGNIKNIKITDLSCEEIGTEEITNTLLNSVQ